MTYDITEIVTILIRLCIVITTAVLIPLAKSRLGQDKLDTALKWVKIAVAAVEQIFDAADGQKKKDYVISYLEERGIYLSEEDVDIAIEAAVLELHSALYGTQKGGSDVSQPRT